MWPNANTRYSEMLAWAAGLFEGEGSTGVWAGRPAVVVAMNDKDAVERFAKIMGCGHVILATPAGVRGYHHDHWRWQISKVEEVRHVLTVLMPFLCERRSAKAQEVLDFLESMPRRRQGRQRSKDIATEHAFPDDLLDTIENMRYNSN